MNGTISIRPATIDDVPAILALIKGLAEYEKLSDQLVATEDDLRRWLFGERPVAEVLMACLGPPQGGPYIPHRFVPMRLANTASTNASAVIAGESYSAS